MFKMILDIWHQNCGLPYMCVVMLFGVFTSVLTNPEIVTNNPVFAEPIRNITVTAGRNVSLACVVDNLQNYRVAWIHTNKYTLLTLQNRVITRSSRFKVSNNSHRTWFLHIYNVQERDRGEYMCQINTVPMMTQNGYLEVVVPPYLDEKLTSSDTDVKEGSDVSLRCVAKGSPEPENTWRRENGEEINLGKTKVTSVRGNYLNITKVSRLHMGAYLCIFHNGVPPSLSKRIMLGVTYSCPNRTALQTTTRLLNPQILRARMMREFGYIQIAAYFHPGGPFRFLPIQCYFLSSSAFCFHSSISLCFFLFIPEIPPPTSIENTAEKDILLSKSEKLRNGHKQNSFKKHEENEEDSESMSSEGMRHLPFLFCVFMVNSHKLFMLFIHN
ncbi:neurotrimin [Parasteatoda tepidariorum]|uniref:neurotrimin n=1 Tax=Parasteatoda tepidariorum TaxID=114398 RepID=UPI0039BC6691